MNDYTDLEQLKNDFVDGRFKFPDGFTLNGIIYQYKHSTNYSMMEIVKSEIKPIVVYATRDKEKAREAGLNQWVLFLWGYTPRNKMLPYDVRTMSAARAAAGKITEADDNDIGSTVEVKVTNLPGSSPLKGKIDTGADISSLHAESFQINRGAGTVTFRCPDLSQNDLTMNLVNQQAVKSADGGMEYRPIVELNIKINGRLLTDVQFNLNDRSHMDFPVLIGKNALLQGKFKIDPTLDEGDDPVENDVDWVYIQETVKDVQPPMADMEKVEQMYKALKESDISFSDLVRYIRTDVTDNIMEDLDN